MNILHINNFHYMRGGSEAVYFETAELLESHGHKSIFFSTRHPKTLPCKTGEYFVSYIDLNAKQSFVNQLKIAGRILYNFEARKRLSMLLDKYPVDIAHLHNIYHNISPSILRELKSRKIPVVMTLHDYKMVCAAYTLLFHGKPCEACSGRKFFMAVKNRCVKNSLIKSILSTIEMYLHHKVFDIYDKVDIFVSPSLFLKNKLLEMGFKKEIIHLPNFIDIHEFTGIKKTSGNKGKSIVYFGRLSYEKGLWTLIETAKRMLNKDVNIKIIGDGSIMKELQNKVNTEHINNVKFLGYIKGKGLFREIAYSIATIIPSEWYENNPVSVIESFALGIPVIGANIGGIPELVKDNETGLVFKPEDATDLCEKVKYMIDNPDKALRMGQNARRFVEQELNAERYYQKLMEIYSQAKKQ